MDLRETIDFLVNTSDNTVLITSEQGLVRGRVSP